MSPEPSNAASYNDLTLDKVIGLFLTRLIAYLIRLDASGFIFAPPDMAHKVASAEGMVHAFIRMRAAEQLENAGLTDAAKAMRTPVWMRNKPTASIDQTAMTPVPTAELIERLKNAMADFERADAMASMLARIILLAITYAFPETRERTTHARIATDPANEPCRASLGPPTIIPVGRGPPYSWPPPLLDPGSTPGKAVEIKDHYINSFPGLREQDRIPERNSKNSHSRDHTRPRRRSTAETKSTKWCEQIRPGKRGRDLSAAIDAHVTKQICKCHYSDAKSRYPKT